MTLLSASESAPTESLTSASTARSLPIGVFDSGMGGLTVLRALQRALPCEDFTYLGDTARLPYGTKSDKTVQRYATQATEQLVAHGIKALVVACNTASASALTHLQQAYSPLPVFGVVEPGAQAAVAGADASGVLVLATQSTISGGAYQRALTSKAPRVPVFGRACPLWVTLAEQGPQALEFTQNVLDHYLRGFTEHGPSTVLLGCTHFPVFSELLNDRLAKSVRVVDSAQTTAAVVAEDLARLDLLSNNKTVGVSRFLATDGVDRFAQVGSHFLGEPIAQVELIDL